MSMRKAYKTCLASSLPRCPIPWMVYYSYHFSDFLEEKVILSCKGMYFFFLPPPPASFSPEWCILFWDEEVLQLHWYIIAVNRNHCLLTVSRDQFGPHTLWPWHLRKINPTLSLRRELTPLEKKDYHQTSTEVRRCVGSAVLLCWSIGRKVFDSFCASRLILLLYNRMTPAEACPSLM